MVDCGVLLFVLQQVALGIEHGQEVGDAVVVTRAGEIERRAGYGRAGAQPLAANLFEAEGLRSH